MPLTFILLILFQKQLNCFQFPDDEMSDRGLSPSGEGRLL